MSNLRTAPDAATSNPDRADSASESGEHRGNTLATSVPSNASSVSRKPRKMDDLDAPEWVYTACLRLRALWR
jgi:hypothetical protein